MKLRILVPLLFLSSHVLAAEPPAVTTYCVDTDAEFQQALNLAAGLALAFDNVHADIRLRSTGSYQLDTSFNGVTFEGLSITGNYEDGNCVNIDEQATTQIALSGSPTLH